MPAEWRRRWAADAGRPANALLPPVRLLMLLRTARPRAGAAAVSAATADAVATATSTAASCKRVVSVHHGAKIFRTAPQRLLRCIARSPGRRPCQHVDASRRRAGQLCRLCCRPRGGRAETAASEALRPRSCRPRRAGAPLPGQARLLRLHLHEEKHSKNR